MEDGIKLTKLNSALSDANLGFDKFKLDNIPNLFKQSIQIPDLPDFEDFTNPVVENLEKINEANQSLIDINKQYLNGLEILTKQNEELQTIVKTLTSDLEKERTAKSKSEKWTYFFAILSSILGVLAIVVPIIVVI